LAFADVQEKMDHVGTLNKGKVRTFRMGWLAVARGTGAARRREKTATHAEKPATKKGCSSRECGNWPRSSVKDKSKRALAN